MTTIIAFFLLSAFIAVVATPYVRKLACCIGAVDCPDERKLHQGVVPRCGGVAVYLGFFFPFVSLAVFRTDVSDLIQFDRMILGFWAGGTVILLVGLWDDIRGLGAYSKFALQAVAAAMAWGSGLRIEGVLLPYIGSLQFFPASLPVTVFWFVLVINATNLIDGLDGLAAGVTLFVCLVLLLICLTTGKLVVAIGFASLAGATLGFLRYNFNPASIFLGDSGSYFLGYMLAGLSVLGSVKSQTTVAIFIPMIALGVPLMDAILAPIRRFFIGKGPFKPDRDHFHHRLLKFGLSPRRAVLLLYGVTLSMGIFALLLVHARDDRAALILLLLGGGAIICVRKVWLSSQVATDHILSDIGDVLSLHRERRTFRGKQMAVYESKSLEEMWGKIVDMSRSLGFDYVKMKAYETAPDSPTQKASVREFRSGAMDPRMLTMNRAMYIILPLATEGQQFGSLSLAKGLQSSPLSQYALRRIEELCDTVVATMSTLSEKGLAQGTKFGRDRRMLRF